MEEQRNIMPMNDNISIRKRLLRVVVHLLAGVGMALLYYIGFSFFFDTPVEKRLKRSTELLNQEYVILNNRYDSLENVLENIVSRDRNVFGTLFESKPYNLEENSFSATKWYLYENMHAKPNRELGDMLESKTRKIKERINDLNIVADRIHQQILSSDINTDYIPSIQPVINKELTLLTASYGMRMHPFYKTLSSHQGVDYSVPEGTRVFATADGVVAKVIKRRTSSGITIIINHNDIYETSYSHLSKANVKVGQRVKRGDIIAHSGNTGLSFAPHLHYEIKMNGMRVDPIYYFFMELSPSQYQKIIKIASTGMQSLD